MSGAQRLPGGETLLTDGPGGRLLRIDDAGEVVWDLDSLFVADGMLAPGQGPEQGATALFKARSYNKDGVELGSVEPGFLEVEPIILDSDE